VFELDYLLDKYIPPPSSNPPTGWEYSNTNYAILGLIVEELTGKDYATVAKEKVFDPLGLKNTSIKTEGMDVKDLNGLWRCFGIELGDLNDVSVNSFLSMWGGAGALVSTTD
jgi:D-alanyl-D-alanine carboxypeptidase